MPLGERGALMKRLWLWGIVAALLIALYFLFPQKANRQAVRQCQLQAMKAYPGEVPRPWNRAGWSASRCVSERTFKAGQ
jgi:hypothetical protein